MVPIVVALAESDLGLPLGPLTWALCFGTCFGGNGTLIGASANVVAVGLAEQQGFPISFLTFFKFGFPSMILSVSTVSVYMLITHVLIPWY
jgi:P protein